MQGLPIIMLCFCSGKVVLTGGKRVEDMQVCWGVLWGIVRDFIR
jgi:TATA-box binding protein (TBP) (component of TFIID and TFIIIB)